MDTLPSDSEGSATAPYDFNFCFPVPQSLQSDRVRLSPLIPSKHAKPLFSQLQTHPEVYTYFSFGPFPTLSSFVSSFLEDRVHSDRGRILFVIYDKTKPSISLSPSSSPSSERSEPSETPEQLEEGTFALAGIIGLLNSSPQNLCTEIGPVIVLPPFQRTHVTSNAVGLLLQYCLNIPSAGADKATPQTSLALRRVTWQAYAQNTRSIRTAQRMGFRHEGVQRWQRVLPANPACSNEGLSTDAAPAAGNGVLPREGDPKRECAGVHTAILAWCWDDWEGGGREMVEGVMSRGA